MTTLLSQGGYGCVYYPGLKCSGSNDNDDELFVTKLQIKDFNSDNEKNIGKMITSIKDYRKYFIPVIKTCDIDIRQVDSELIADCNVVHSYDNSKYYLMTIEYVKNDSIDNVIRRGKTIEEKKKSFIQVLNTYKYILNSIEILVKHDIVHLDIKIDNILYSLQDMSPLIIDFGLSIPMKNLNSETYESYFYSYIPEYYPWPLEVHVICYLVNRISGNLTEHDIKLIVNEFCKSNVPLQFFSNDFYGRYVESSMFYLKKFIGIDRETVIKTLITYWNTWDSYSNSIMTIHILGRIFKKYVHKNKMLISLVELLVTNISPDPELRLSPEESIKEFNKCFRMVEDTNSYTDLISDFR